MTKWIDKESGLTCQTVNFHGYWNGYVKIPANHQMYNKQYHECIKQPQCETDSTPSLIFSGVPFYDCEHTPERMLDVHGGITFTGQLIDNQFNPDDWWIGFDTAHYGDEDIPEEYVISETEQLARQLV